MSNTGALQVKCRIPSNLRFSRVRGFEFEVFTVFQDSHTSSDSSSGNDGGDFPALAKRPARDLEAFGELPALQSGHTRSQSRGLTMGASCADDLSAYAMRAMEAEKPMEEKAAEVERAHDSLLEEQLEKAREWLEKLERRGIGPRARGVRGCRVGRQGQ